jgi:hypothetical protein
MKEMAMRGTIVGLALAAALGLLAAGANFGCTQNTSDQAAPGGGTMAPATTGVKVVNNRCPMTGTPIDPNNVPASLTRDYKGMKVGFCCGPHPAAWDKLSDAEKDAKLAAVMTPPGSAGSNVQTWLTDTAGTRP